MLRGPGAVLLGVARTSSKDVWPGTRAQFTMCKLFSVDIRRNVRSGPAVGLSLGEVLELPAVRDGAPQLVTGQDQLDRLIRWAHVSELTDIGPLLRGGELVLTTGIGLPDDPSGSQRYVDGLVAAEVGALMIELGRRFDAVPGPLADAADRAGLPLIVLHREVRFVEVTEAVHTRIVDAQVAQLRWSDRLHRRFTALTVDGADVTAIVAAAADLAGGPVVLENRAHQVIAVADGGVDLGPVLDDWDRRSRGVARGEQAGWTVVPVVARGVAWGRLVAVDAVVPGDAASVLERAAAALALNRLSERDELALRLRAHQEVLATLTAAGAGEPVPARVLEARAASLGVPLRDRNLVGIVVAVPARTGQEPERLGRDDVERVVAAAAGQFDALVDAPKLGEVRLVASFDVATDRAEVLQPFARRLHGDGPRSRLTIGVGSTVRTAGAVARSLREAAYVAAAAPSVDQRKDYLELLDIRVRGLLHLLREDPRLQDFVHRELGALLAYDTERGSDLVATLRAYLETGRNKTRTAAVLHLSRPGLYARLTTIGRVLDADLDDPETCLALHVALLALEASRR